MSIYSQRIKNWLDKRQVNAEFLGFDQSVHSVAEAVAVSGYPENRFTKSIVMVDADNQPIIAVVCAEHRASTDRVRKAMGLADRPAIASPDQTEALLNQQTGGNTPLNADQALILIDPKVLEKDWVIVGGGDNRHLVKIKLETLRGNVEFTEVRVRK